MDETTRRGRVTEIGESVLLAIVALLAAFAGFAAARWSTDSRLRMAEASTARTEASQAYLDAIETRNLDSSMFNTWFIAWTAGDARAQELAVRRFRPEFRTAFEAWVATDPAGNPSAPPGPTYMAEYEQPAKARGDELSRRADERFTLGAEGGSTADHYIQVTVLLAAVLFIVGLSTQFGYRVARLGLLGVATSVALYAGVLILVAPRPPG